MTDEVDDFLEHHGVKGMKWGVRRQPRPMGVEIKGARSRVGSEKAQVKKAFDKANNIKDPQKRGEALLQARHMKTSFLKNPDRVTSSRMTNGETAALAILALPLAGAAAARAGASVRSSVIAKRQASGYYDKHA